MLDATNTLQLQILMFFIVIDPWISYATFNT
jgi:hypothetical protein